MTDETFPPYLRADPLARQMQSNAWPLDLVFDTCERAAVLEHDAGQDRAFAEVAAIIAAVRAHPEIPPEREMK